jgi:hypothetical protein
VPFIRKLSDTVANAGAQPLDRRLRSKQESTDSLSSISTTGSAASTTRSAGESRDQGDGAATAEDAESLGTSDSSSTGKLRKFPSTRSFSVASLNTKVDRNVI